MKYFLMMITLLMLAACGGEEKQTEQETVTVSGNRITLTEAQKKSAGITTGQVQQQTLSSVIRVTGKIDVPPQNLVSVSVPLGGYLKSTKLLPGMHLKRGEVIAVLEDQQYIELQQNYLTTRAKLEMASAEYKRQKELNESKAGSDKLLQQAKAEYESMKISLSAFAEKLRLINVNPQTLTEESLSRNINLYAPFDGYVSKVLVNVGKYVAPSDVLFELVNPEDIHLNVKVFEKDLMQLSIGQVLYAYTNSNPQQKYKCEIILISKDIAPDRTAEVHCHFENYDKSLLPGMYMNADIELKNKMAYTVPEKAIVSYGDKSFLFVETGNSVYEMLEAKTGDSEKGMVELLNYDVFLKKPLVFDGSYTLLMKLKNGAEEE